MKRIVLKGDNDNLGLQGSVPNGVMISLSGLTPVSVGTIAYGGYIYNTWSGGTHGSVMTTYSLGTTNWGCEGTLIGDIGLGWNGISFPEDDIQFWDIGLNSCYNTTKIVNGCSETGIAAKLCNDLNASGYTDWCLPNWTEICKINDVYFMMSGVNMGLTPNTMYWTSTEYDDTFAVTFFIDPELPQRMEKFPDWQHKTGWTDGFGHYHPNEFYVIAIRGF